jgi:hypothetical protein
MTSSHGGHSASRWQPRCEGCGIFVPAYGRLLQDYRWCPVCEAALTYPQWMRAPMTSRDDLDEGFRARRANVVAGRGQKDEPGA